MTTFAEDPTGLAALGDLIIESDHDGEGLGDMIFKTRGVERARIANDGTGTGVFAGGGSQPYAIQTVALSSAELLALNVTPKLVVPAPGAGLVVVPIFASLTLTFATTPYTQGGSGLSLFYDIAATIQAAQISAGSVSAALTASESTWGADNLTLPLLTANVGNPVANLPLVVINQGGALTLGDGSAELTVAYITVPIGV